jgi:putative ABC transport system permease protein
VGTLATALFKKSWRDLSKKKARTIFTVLTIAMGVMGMSMLAIDDLADMGMEDQLDEVNANNLQIRVEPVNLTEVNIDEMETIENVNIARPGAFFVTKMYIGERRNDAVFIGIDDFDDQAIDVIKKESGNTPGHMEVMTEYSNELNGIYDGKRGESFTIIDSSGSERDLTITGTGKSLMTAAITFGGTAVFYAQTETVRSMANFTGYNTINVDLDKTDEASIEKSVEDIRDYLTAETTVVAFAQIPTVRPDGEWAGKEMFNTIISSMSVLTLLILLASAFLISNTMNTIISEQKKEIGQMKAIGATKNQVFRSFLTTSFIMGVMGAIIGAIVGIWISYFVTNLLGGPFGIDFGLNIHIATIVMSLVVGIGIVILASLPALIRSSRVVIREALESSGITANFGDGALDRMMMRGQNLPRSIQMGLRNVARKKGRSYATILQVALAVGLFMGMISFGNSLGIATEGAWDDRTFDIAVFNADDVEALSIIGGIDGVDFVEPLVTTGGQIGDRRVEIWGYVQDTRSWDVEGTLVKGRWLSAADHASNASVIVIGEALSRFVDLDVGDRTKVMTATGEFEFEVIGIQESLMDNGQAVMAPIGTLQHLLRIDTISGVFVHTSSNKHDDIDRVSTDVEDTMAANGYIVSNLVHYVSKQRNKDQNASIVTIFMFVSMLIVFISMIGLMSTLTMNILDRTKEIGMLRCIGSKARDLRRVFSTEAAFLAFVGLVIGMPLGYVIAEIIGYSVANSMNLEMTVFYAWDFIPWAFIITIIGTIVIIQAPLLRATRFKPGDALRYQ